MGNNKNSPKQALETPKIIEAKNLNEYIRLNEKTVLKGNLIKAVYNHEGSMPEALRPLKTFLDNKPYAAEIESGECPYGPIAVLYYKDKNGDLKKVEIDPEKISEFKNIDLRKNPLILHDEVRKLGGDLKTKPFGLITSDVINFINNAIKDLKIEIPEEEEKKEAQEKLPETITSIMEKTAEKVQKITITPEQISEIKNLIEKAPSKPAIMENKLKELVNDPRDKDFAETVLSLPVNGAWFKCEFFNEMTLYFKDQNNNLRYKEIPTSDLLKIFRIGLPTNRVLDKMPETHLNSLLEKLGFQPVSELEKKPHWWDNFLFHARINRTI
ncbi:hypothetical protein HZA39_01980 [Candidatus Peregrinibacteria bacterium]|nr:hypothetical protein [Candidatus Peregrinibacteria bacterium]